MSSSRRISEDSQPELIEAPVHTRKTKIAAAIAEWIAINGGGLALYTLADLYAPGWAKNIFQKMQDNYVLGKAWGGGLSSDVFRTALYAANPANYVMHVERITDFVGGVALTLAASELTMLAYVGVNKLAGRDVEDISPAENVLIPALLRTGINQTIGFFKRDKRILQWHSLSEEYLKRNENSSELTSSVHSESSQHSHRDGHGHREESRTVISVKGGHSYGGTSTTESGSRGSPASTPSHHHSHNHEHASHEDDMTHTNSHHAATTAASLPGHHRHSANPHGSFASSHATGTHGNGTHSSVDDEKEFSNSSKFRIG